MKVLVTGGCGLIGYHAAMYFHKQGHEVEVMDNLERSALLGHKVEDLRATFNKKLLEKEGIRVYLDDVSNSRNWDLHAGHDLILHYAGQCGVPTSIEKPRRDMEVNLIGTFNALEYARRHSATLCFASTNKVYPLHDCFVKKDNRWHFMKPEWDVKGFPVNTDLVGSRTPYGWSKYSADLLCQEYAHTYGVRTGVFRMSCIYGPNQFGFEEQGWATWFIIAALKNIPITIYGDGAQVRDMLYVEDCVKAYEAFYNSDMHHGVFNLGGGVGHTTTIWDHYKTIHAMADAKNPKVTFDTWRPLDQQCYVSDISPLHTTLGWQPTTSIQSGTDKTMEWVFDHLEVF